MIGAMRVAAALAALLVLSGCGGARSAANKCPRPVTYDTATLDKISLAVRDLPKDSILRQVLEDYENERDDLRFCRD